MKSRRRITSQKCAGARRLSRNLIRSACRLTGQGARALRGQRTMTAHPKPLSPRRCLDDAAGLWTDRSPPLAQTAAFERDDLAPRAVVETLLRHLLGNPEQALAPVHFLPDILRPDARSDPQHHQMVDQIGAFLDDGIAVAEQGIEDHLDRFLGKLLRHLAAAGAQQPCGPRRRRIVVAAGERRVIEAGDRISHAASTIARYRRNCVKVLIAQEVHSSWASRPALPPAAAVLTV